MRNIIAAAVIGAAGFGAASAQTAPAVSFVNTCVSELRASGLQQPQTGCACGAGVLGGSMTPRQFTVVGRLSPQVNSQPGMVAAIEQMQAEGYAIAEIQTVAQLMTAAAPVIERVCGPLEREARSMSVATGTETARTPRGASRHHLGLDRIPAATLASGIGGRLGIVLDDID